MTAIRRAPAFLLASALLLPPPADAAPRVPPAQAPARQADVRAEVCAAALTTLLKAMDPGSVVYVVPALGDSTGAWRDGEVAVRAVARAARLSGRRLEFAAPGSDAGSWARPENDILVAVRDVRIGPGAKLAWLEMDVTGSDGVTRRLRFSLKREDRGWVPIEWGPAENES